ncbi:recombinase zinc beta ribbon domain-containing protein [Anaeromyxobacter sp. K]|uniref:recombinase zinc beta ribbon domain-containing protein n=1 Tax=Anaeromyxobacter sp. (strain K) TaxID=447217 RepID=UPI00015F9022|nr:recombinase zinc beta ribbon domain-containing protein [Anaeromyxobacter sp. K]
MKNRQTGKRVARRRPESEWIVTPRPDLAIVPRDVFDRVQALSAARGSKLKRGSGGRYKGTEPGRVYSPYLLSGLLKCGICGAAMVVYGGKVNPNSGRVYRGYQCPSRKRRGSSTCTNTTTISQEKIETAVIDELKKKILSPENVTFYESQFRQAFSEARDQDLAPQAKEIERQLGEAKKAVENLVAYLKTQGHSEAVARELTQAEARVRELEAELAGLAPWGGGCSRRRERPSGTVCCGSRPRSTQTRSPPARCSGRHRGAHAHAEVQRRRRRRHPRPRRQQCWWGPERREPVTLLRGDRLHLLAEPLDPLGIRWSVRGCGGRI